MIGKIRDPSANPLTAQLKITPDDPETEENEFSVCVDQVWDEAPKGIVTGG
jgi:hypothetical protein